MKKILTAIILMTMVVSMFAGCGSSSGSGSGTVAQTLQAQFTQLASEGKTAEEIAMALSENKVFNDVAMGSMPVQEGFLNGFSEEIKGFKETSYMFSPMIGTIPFVGYVFETDDPEALVKTLDEKAMLNWNICTVADEKVSSVSGNYVFFVMAPFNFEQ